MRFVSSLLLLPAALLLHNYCVGSSVAAAGRVSKTRLAFYVGPGTSDLEVFYSTLNEAAAMAFGSSYSLSNFTAPDVVEHLSRESVDILVVPGGSGNTQANGLGDDGLNAVREFVAAGGGYIGTCGGAFLGLSHLKFYGDPPPPTQEPWDRGHGPVQVQFSSAGNDDLRLNYSGNVTIEYWQGPIVKAKDFPSSVQVFATFRSEIHSNHPNETTGEMINTPAITALDPESDAGRVVLNSPHPELPRPDGSTLPGIYAGELEWLRDKQIVGISRPQFLLFTRVPDLRWHQSDPTTITPDFLMQPIRGLELANASSPDGSLMIGNELIFSILQEPNITILEETLQKALDAAVSAKVPLSIVLDSENWWGQVPELWNWWNESSPGFDAANVNNVEWTRAGDPTSAVKIGWRNWGSQLRVPPQQNILSPAVRAFVQPRVQALATVISKWLHVDPIERSQLLATVKVGWEAGVQYNAFYYPDGNARLGDPNVSADSQSGLNFSDTANPLGAGQPVLGYAAAHSAGFRLEANSHLTGDMVAAITREYVSFLAKTVLTAGIPAELISNHVGGQVPPYAAVPFEAAFVSESVGIPGWSFYWDAPNSTKNPLGASMQKANRTRWAAAEWRLGAADEQGWLTHFEATLGFLDCRHLAVYNWDNDFEKLPPGLAAVRSLFAARK